MRLGRLFVQMYFADPVFGSDDRVGGGGGGGGGDDGLPAELKGKTPAQIAAHYAERERLLRAELSQPPRREDPPPPPGPTNTEFWNDPTKSTKDMIRAQAMSKEEFDRLSASARPSMIWAAKEMTKQKHSDFERVIKEIDEIMAKVPEYQRTDPVMWETAYVYAKGAAHDRLAAEDRAAPVITGERVNPGGTAPPPDADLYKVTANQVGAGKSAGSVADHLGVSHDSYRKSSKILDGDGLLPLTVDNRRTR